MDKVWFKLRQTHYRPGPEESILAGDGDDSQAPLCLGNCIADLKHLDFPLNSGAVVAFPSRMNVFPSHVINFAWDRSRSRVNSAALAVGAPIAAALGLLTVKASIALAFERSVRHHEQYSRLDTYIMQPTPRYIEQCLQTDDLNKYIRNRADWSFFMITGIKVARLGGQFDQRTNRVHVEQGAGVEVPTIATAEATVGNAVQRQETIEQGSISDFTWAVRLAKVHKGFLMTDWSCDPYTHRATFNTEGAQQVDVGAVLRSEGLSSVTVIEDDKLDQVILLDNYE